MLKKTVKIEEKNFEEELKRSGGVIKDSKSCLSGAKWVHEIDNCAYKMKSKKGLKKSVKTLDKVFKNEKNLKFQRKLQR